MKKLSIIIPCYQNEANLEALKVALIQLCLSLPDFHLQVVAVDDGSTDHTFAGLQSIKNSNPPFALKIVKLTGNFGSYNAFLAGLHYAEGDVFVQLHADLQDPPEYIPEMLKHWENGYKLVIGVREKREETYFHQLISNIYHNVIKKLALPHIPLGGYDLIVFDKTIRDHIVQQNESNINLVYQISSLKHAYAAIPIVRKLRTAGKSQWTLFKKYKLFIDSIVAFSYKPIYLITLLSLCSIPASIGVIIYLSSVDNISVERKIILSFMILISIALLLSISIIAEYLWRTLEAARKRPPFIIDKIVD